MLGLSGEEVYEIQVDETLKTRPGCDVIAGDRNLVTTCRIDTPVELEYYRNGGILQTVLRKMLKGG